MRWLTGVSGRETVAFLQALALDESLDVDIRTPLSSATVRAIALHRDPTAVPALMAMAETKPVSPHLTRIRREAMQGLGQSADPRALEFLAGIIAK
jgi:hypothetical protein